MSLHPRTIPVQKAKNEIELAVLKLVESHGLTNVEAVGILLQIVSQWHLYTLRAERHPDDSGKKADEA